MGEVDRRGAGSRRFEVGERIGIPWLRATCHRCRHCRRGSENLCEHPRFPGWTDDGGCAELAVIDEAYAYRLPEQLTDVEAAPLLCAGIIGYRALWRSGFSPGDRLGIWGFGGSAHLTAQVAIARLRPSRPARHPTPGLEFAGRWCGCSALPANGDLRYR